MTFFIFEANLQPDYKNYKKWPGEKMNNGGHKVHLYGAPAVPRGQKMSMLPSERFESEAQ